MLDKTLNCEPESINFYGLKTIKSNIECPHDFDKDKIKSFNYRTDFRMGFNIEEKIIKTELEVSISTVSDREVNLEEATGHFLNVFFFEQARLQDFAKIDEKGVVDVNDNLAIILASVTYSTTRGILVEKIAGSPLAGFVLPILSAQSLLIPKVDQ